MNFYKSLFTDDDDDEEEKKYLNTSHSKIRIKSAKIVKRRV